MPQRTEGEGDMRKGMARTMMRKDDKRQGKRSEGMEEGEEKRRIDLSLLTM